LSLFLLLKVNVTDAVSIRLLFFTRPFACHIRLPRVLSVASCTNTFVNLS